MKTSEKGAELEIPGNRWMTVWTAMPFGGGSVERRNNLQTEQESWSGECL
jgi:hypothetical protein